MCETKTYLIRRGERISGYWPNATQRPHPKTSLLSGRDKLFERAQRSCSLAFAASSSEATAKWSVTLMVAPGWTHSGRDMKY